MNRTLSVRFAFLIVLLSVISALIIGSLFSALDPSILSGAKPGLSTYIAMFVGQGFLIVPILFFLTRKKLPLAESLRLNPVSREVVFTTILLSIGAMIISDEINILVDMIIPMPDSFLQVEAMLTPENPLSLFLLIITIVFLAPIGEELLFRGFLQKKLEESWQDITRAVLVTSLFFAFIHMNPVWIIQIYLLGVILGYLAWKTGSILTSLVLHSLNNGAALILTNYSESINPYYLWNNHVSPLFLVIAICSLSFGFYNLNKLVRE